MKTESEQNDLLFALVEFKKQIDKFDIDELWEFVLDIGRRSGGAFSMDSFVGMINMSSNYAFHTATAYDDAVVITVMDLVNEKLWTKTVKL